MPRDRTADTRLFGKKLRTFVIHQWSDSSYFGWSRNQAWLIPGIVALLHHDNDGGKLLHVEKVGWSIRFVRPRFKRLYGGFQFTITSPNATIH